MYRMKNKLGTQTHKQIIKWYVRWINMSTAKMIKENVKIKLLIILPEF
jgi:hypothetical protein